MSSEAIGCNLKTGILWVRRRRTLGAKTLLVVYISGGWGGGGAVCVFVSLFVCLVKVSKSGRLAAVECGPSPYPC